VNDGVGCDDVFVLVIVVDVWMVDDFGVGFVVEDARIVLEWISGKDGKDSNCIEEAFSGKREALRDLKKIRIGIPKEYFGEGLDKGVEKVVRDAIKKLEELGAEVVEIELPNTKYAVAVYYIIMASEVSSNLARFDGIRFGGTRDLFGPEPKRRIMLGTFALSTGYFDDYFIQAAKVRTLIKQDFDKAFEKCDVIVGPVSPTVAWNLGEKMNDPLKMYLSDTYTIPASLAGLPGLSVPCGFSDGLPVGLQILGNYMEEC
jgi:aspartyl-tRNA(Asn)/glutamyl-tRNA(Gln) amidotransferase subunit A